MYEASHGGRLNEYKHETTRRGFVSFSYWVKKNKNLLVSSKLVTRQLNVGPIRGTRRTSFSKGCPCVTRSMQSKSIVAVTRNEFPGVYTQLLLVAVMVENTASQTLVGGSAYTRLSL